MTNKKQELKNVDLMTYDDIKNEYFFAGGMEKIEPKRFRDLVLRERFLDKQAKENKIKITSLKRLISSNIRSIELKPAFVDINNAKIKYAHSLVVLINDISIVEYNNIIHHNFDKLTELEDLFQSAEFPLFQLSSFNEKEFGVSSVPSSKKNKKK